MIEGLDFFLTWLLWIPRDLALGLMAISSALLATILRQWTTNQDRLRRCLRDSVRLRERLRLAKCLNDKQEIGRLRSLLAQVKRVQLRADLLVMAWSIGPLGLGAYWASVRMNYLPTHQGDIVELQAYFPLSSIGRLAHVVPNSNFELRTPAIQEISSDESNPSRATARWLVVPLIRRGSVELAVASGSKRVRHLLLVDNARSAMPRIIHAGTPIAQTELHLTQYRFLGVVPGFNRIGIDPWLVAHLLLAIPLLPLLRRLVNAA